MQTRTEATIEDLYNAPDDGKYELVTGRLVKMSPTGYRPHRVGFRIARSLADYEERTGIGEAMSDGVAYVVDLPNRHSFSEDAVADAEPALPGWTVSVAQMFARRHR